MPVLSKFYGIVIRMLFIRPFAAHFHAIYGDSEVLVGIQPVRIINGDAPEKVREMVMQWAREHQQELLLAWKRCGMAQAPLAIAPLR
ncbi:MAG: DUF4160 domain-containing protein [Verrucomicrobiota bacterium]